MGSYHPKSWLGEEGAREYANDCFDVRDLIYQAAWEMPKWYWLIIRHSEI